MGTLRLLYLREIGYVKVDQYNAMKEVFRVVLLRTGTEQISVRESLATVLGDAKALVENADAKSFQKLSQRLTDVQVLAARLTRFSHQAFEAMAEFVSKEPCALRSHYVQLADLPDLQHQAVKLVVSSASQRTIQEITKLYAGVEGGKKVIPVITDADKRDFQWRQKLEYAKQTGEWLIIIMDEFYVVRFETLVASKVKAATDFILWLLMAESSQDLFRFVQETENESGGATQLSIQTYFERLEGFRVLKEKSDAYAASRLRVAPTDVVAKEQMETSDGRSENGEIVQTLRSLDEIGLLRTSTEDRRQHAFDFERACWLNHWLEMLASIESEALEHETGNRIRQNLSLLANSFHFLRRWLACGWPKEVTAGAPMNMESFLNMILLSVVEAGTCHQSRITFSSVQPIQKAALVWTDVKLLNGSYDVVKGIVQTGMGLSSTIHELWLDIQNVGNGVKNPRPTQPSETIFQCVCKVRHPLNPASEKFNLQLPSVVPRNQLIWSLVQAECANPDLGDTIVPVSEKLKTLDSRTVQHITAYLTFSPDTLHERHIIMRDVMPSLQASFTEEGILLHAVELYSYKGQTVEYEKHLLAAKSQLCRSDVYVAIVGNQLGEMLKNSAGKGGGKYSLDDEISMVLPKDESSVAPSELSSISSLRACYFLFRDPTFSRSVPKSHRHRYESRSHTESRLLAELRARITQKTETTDLFEVLLDYPCFFSRIEGGEIRVGGLDRISTQLTAWLRNGVHRIVEERVQKVRGKDEDLQFGAGESHLTGPVRYLDEIRSAFDGQEKSFSSCVLLDGPAGAGKTAVAKAVGRSYCDNGYLVMANFVGTWLGSDSSVRMLQRFSEDIMHAIRGAVEEMVGDNTEVIKRRFWSLMDEAVTRGFKLLFIIDEVDCIDRAGPAEEVSWLPPLEKLSAQVWRNTRWLCTATDASTLLPVFKLKYQNITTIRLTDLTDAHRDTYLQSIHPPLDMKLIQQVRSNPFSNRALLLHLVSKDASLLPASSQSTHDLSTTAIFQPLLDRLEASQPKVSPSALQLLALSPTGLVESEWSHLTNVPAIEWNLFFTDVLPYLSTTEGNRYVTFHEVFGEAIRERYIANTGDEKKVHRVLAEGFLALETKYNPNGFGFGGICTMRTSDILHHLFKAEASVKEILPVLCSLHNLQMVFETGVDASMRILEDFARLETILEKNSAAELGVAGTDRDVMVRKIREYKAFVRWCGRWARKETRLVGSLAWNFGCGMGGFVKGEVDEARMKLTKRDGGSGGQREKNGSWKGGAPVVGGSEDRNAKSMTWKRPAPSTKNLFGGKSASNPFPIIERVELSDLTSVPKVPFAFTPLSPQFENPCPIIALLPYTIHTSPQPPHRVVLSVSSSGSVHMYDLNTYTYIKTLAPNPLLPNHVRKCCLTARGNVVCGMKDRGLCLIILGFDNAVSLEDSGWAVRIAEEWWEGEDLVWEGGGVWTTKDKEGKGLKWIPVVEEGDFALETQDLNSKQKEYLNGICDDVVTVSDDGSKVVIVSGHWNALVVLGVGGYASGGTHGSSYSGLKELQRFQIPAEAMKDMEFGVGAFSLRKNLLAVTIIENRNEKTSSTQSLTSTAAFTSITVTTYNIDTHARHSLIKIPSGVEPPSSIGFSLDETRLYIGFGNGSISVADIQKGHIINKFRIGQGPVHKILISSWKGEERVFLGVGPEVVTCELKHSENEAGKIEDVGVVHGGRILDIQVMGRSSDGPLSFVSSCSEGVVIHSTKEDMRAPVVVRSTRESRGVTFLHHSKTLDLMVGAIGSDVVVWDLTEKVEHVPQSFREVARHTTSPYTFTRKVYIYPHPTLKHKLCLLVWAWDGMLSLWMISRRVDTGKGSEENVSGRSSTTGGSGYGNYVVEPSAVWEELAMVLADPPVVLEQNSDAGHGQHLRVLLARDDVGMVLDGVSGRKVREFWTKDGEDIVRLKWGRSTGGKAPVFWCGRATLYEDGEVLSDDVAWPISGELDLSIQGCLPDPMGRYIAYHGRYRKKIFERTTSDTVVVLPTLAIWPKRNDGTSSALPGNPPLDPTDFALHLPHYQKEITNYGFSSDGRYVITVASDFFLRIWNTDRVSSKNPSRSVHSSYRHPQLHALYPLQTTAMPASMTIIPSDPAGNVSVLVGDVEGRIVLYRVI
ncbi:hypothetical protein HK097_006660 [Rhizophlyctis rosea]|uniref:Uncharacterized protein n=1 Tax=Rhizophlyctis rosea TaxID=64517 RepID=A0AAD5SE02_9FUNG|nr:hypothetical protein HK097_006660 [Rhizophlyctis rosea]